ncbi:ATP-grasp domain-containing protein [Actinomycetospora sp. NBRC 106378]|uniref:ATP-grasp domain-containing protein n=1 Tax=Actinomycetospora sp. NBRC 106378 TaxID=3032208 RepID=UPI0024A03B88|nr:ATP-grasp domain-containing protein [Actinomycetospora sp. NBRC 106378]GLZ51896.1 argininosuccinate lyase [Actinomycetospora sp. NBRC 106378]
MTAAPTLLMLGVGRMGRPYLAAARRLGVRVHAVELAARVDGLVGEVDEVLPCRGPADEMWAESAHAAAAAHRPDGVIAFSEPQVMAAALVADEYGLPGPSLRAATTSRNKGLQRARFAAAGIPGPEYLVVDRLSQAAEWAATRWPVMVKSLSGAGSAGVELVADPEGWTGAVAAREGEGRLLVERVVAGPEYSWEALVRDGEVLLANVTEKQTTGAPRFIEIGHRLPARLDPAHVPAVEGLGEAVVAALGMRTGVVHLEFRLGDAGPVVIEVAVRTPGDHIMDLLGLAHGVDWFEALVRLALGWEPAPLPSTPPRLAAVHLPVAPAGTVRAVTGFEEIRAHPHVVLAEADVVPGQAVPVLRSSADRVGRVVLAAPDGETLDATLETVRTTVGVDVTAAG